VAVGDAHAATVYKLTDNEGRITYSSKAPRDFNGSVVTLDFEVAAVAVDAAQPPEAAPAAKTRRLGAGEYSEIRLAEAKLDEATKALEYARDNSTPDDWIHFGGNLRGATRGRGPTPEYAERLERLAMNVKDAETSLAEAEGRYRRSF